MPKRTKSDLLLEYAAQNNLSIVHLPLVQLQMNGEPFIMPPRFEALIREESGDYAAQTKPGESFWIGIGKFSLWIHHLAEGITIDAYPRDDEMRSEIDSMQLWNDDLPAEEDEDEDALYP